jgi:hypothetical protein
MAFLTFQWKTSFQVLLIPEQLPHLQGGRLFSPETSAGISRKPVQGSDRSGFSANHFLFHIVGPRIVNAARS